MGLNPTQWLLYERVRVKDDEIIREMKSNDKSDRNVTLSPVYRQTSLKF